MLLMPGEAGRFRWGKLLSRTKLGVRWIVVASARTPLQYFYRVVYRAHVWYAVRTAKGFAGTKAIYIARSVATGEIAYGVSDIDVVMVGDWPEEEQIRLMRRLGILAAISPLYDSGMWQQVHNENSLRDLWETDYFFQSRFDEGRRQWKLEHGEDLVAALPSVPKDRLGGGYYMEVRSWWLHLIASVFGSGPTAKDAIFRNSIAYKSVVGILEIARAIPRGASLEHSRKTSLRKSIEDSSGPLRQFLERLEESARGGHLRFRGDIQGESLSALIPVLDRIHLALQDLPSFASIGPFEIDAEPSELLRQPAAIEHARFLAAHAREQWKSFRAAYLAPSAACFALDDLLLLIEIDSADPPSLQQLRELCDLHAARRARLSQRIALYLLLPGGALQLEFINFTEMWRVMIFPPSTPDLFTLIESREFQIDGDRPAGGHQYSPGSRPTWSRFAHDLALEELTVRRSVLSRVTPDVFPSNIEILRNVWRHLQLEVLVRTSEAGHAKFALAPAAIRRALDKLGFGDDSLLQSLEDSYKAELEGRGSEVRSQIPQIISYLGRFC